MSQRVNYLGRTVGRILVLREGFTDTKRARQYYCVCECGSPMLVSSIRLGSKGVRSCGCANVARKQSKIPTYGSWRKMIDRCFNPANKDFPRYGGRGITVCANLKNGVAALIESIGVRPSGLTIDRIDNSGSYTCGNCVECREKNWPLNVQWATRAHQSRNQERNIRVEIGGETHCLGEWAAVTGIHYQTLSSRYFHGDRGELLIRTPRSMSRK